MFKLIAILFVNLYLTPNCESARNFINNEKLDKNLQVSTTSGIIQGRKVVTRNGFSYYSYQGIPYAEPPLNNLRFRAPVLAKPWKGILDATKEQTGCTEVIGTLDFMYSSGSEDCLYVNIFTPKNPKSPQELLPVVVWIFGGAFIFGNSSTAFYGPDNLVQQDIVVVTFNYRIGLFGFLSTEDLSSPGNYGLKDQNLVLRWVQQNIKVFGGDNNRVTLAGQSAGAVAVMYHMLSPKSRGLFHKSIVQSGTPLCTWAVKGNAKTTAFDIGLASGIKAKTTKELITQLRKVDIDVLKRATHLMILVGFPQIPFSGFPFAPVIEPPHKEAFFTGHALELFETGKFFRIPMMMSFTTNEIMIFSDVVKPLLSLFSVFDISPGLIPNSNMNIEKSEERTEVGLKIKKHYLKGSSYLDANIKNIIDQYSDDYFIRPMIRTLKLIYKYIPVYFASFSYISDFGLKSLPILKERHTQGSTHNEDVFFIWNWRFNNAPYPTSKDKHVSQKMVRLWKNFITTGNPTPTKEKLLDDIIWPTVNSPDNMTYLNIDTKFTLRQNFRKEHMEFWEDLYRRYGHPPYTTL